jgi:hypothetical protein
MPSHWVTFESYSISSVYDLFYWPYESRQNMIIHCLTFELYSISFGYKFLICDDL